MSAVQAAQIAFAVAEFAADIGDDDPEASEAFDEALADLSASPPESAEDAAGRLRFLVCVSDRYRSCESIGAEIRAAMIGVAEWLAPACGDIREAA